MLKQIVFLDNNALDWFAEYDGKIYLHLPKEYYELYIINEVNYEFEYARNNEEAREIQKSAKSIILEYPIKIFKPLGLLSDKDIKGGKQDNISNDEAHYGGWDEGFFLPKSVIDFLNSDFVKRKNEEARKAKLTRPGLRRDQADIMLAALSTTYPVLTNDVDGILKEARNRGYKIIRLKEDIENPGRIIHDYLTLNNPSSEFNH